MKSTSAWSLALVCLLASACIEVDSSKIHDPSGDWALTLLVTAGTGDGAERVDSAGLFTARIQPASSGGGAFDVLLKDAAGGTRILVGAVEGDQLRLWGSLPWEHAGMTGTARVLGSAVTIRDSILFGAVEVELTGGVAGTERWYLSAFDPGSVGQQGIPALGWWRLDQSVVLATGDFASTMGDISDTILFVGPHQIFKFVVVWWRTGSVWGGVTTAQGDDGFNLAGWSRAQDDAGMTWQETLQSFPVEVSGSTLEPNQILLEWTGDKAGQQTSLYTGSRVAAGTAPSAPATIWAERFISSEPRPASDRAALGGGH